MTRLSTFLWWGFIALAIGVYSLPWVTNPGASLTLNGYDLAEWSSLHPVVRAADPPLIAAFALRSPLLCISILIAFAPRRNTWLRTVLILAIVGVLLPPPEFFTSSFDDPNFRQMLLLAIAAFACGAAGAAYPGQRWRMTIQFAAIFALITASLGGLVTGLNLMRQFDLPVQIGPGGVGLILLAALYGACLIIKRGNLGQVTS